MGFGNAILGGASKLIRRAIQSPNYVAGTSGWSINRDGTAEFVGLILRTGSSGKYIVIGAGGANIIQFFSGLAGETAPGYLLVDVSGGPPATEGYVELAAPALGGNVPKVTLTSDPNPLFSNAALISPGSISIVADSVAEISGALINLTAAGDITVQPGGELIIDGTPATLASAAGDLVLNPASGRVTLAQGQAIKRGGIAAPSYQNGWTNLGGGFQNGGYIELPDHTGMLLGLINAGTTTSGTVLFSLPAQLRPANNHVFICSCNGGRKAQVQVQAGGDVQIQNPDAGVTWLSMDGCRWPISGF